MLRDYERIMKSAREGYKELRNQLYNFSVTIYIVDTDYNIKHCIDEFYQEIDMSKQELETFTGYFITQEPGGNIYDKIYDIYHYENGNYVYDKHFKTESHIEDVLKTLK